MRGQGCFFDSKGNLLEQHCLRQHVIRPNLVETIKVPTCSLHCAATCCETENKLQCFACCQFWILSVPFEKLSSSTDTSRNGQEHSSDLSPQNFLVLLLAAIQAFPHNSPSPVQRNRSWNIEDRRGGRKDGLLRPTQEPQ